MNLKAQLQERVRELHPRELISDDARFRSETLPQISCAYEGRWYLTEASGSRRRFMRADAYPEHPIELVSPYISWLSREAGVKLRAPARRSLDLLDIPAPMHFAGERRGRYAYVDVRSAYYAIYRRTSYDCRVWISDDEVVHVGRGGMLLSHGSEIFASDRLCRNSIVGIARTRRVVTVRHGERVVEEHATRMTSPGLWAYIAAELHTLARIALDHGAVYVNTDGYIVPERQADALIAAIGSLGYSATIRARGVAHLPGFGSFRFPGHVSLTYPMHSEPLSRVLPLRLSTRT